MDLDLRETFKVAFAVAGGVMLVYQAFAVMTRNAPLRAVVNPHRRRVLLAGVGLLSLGYGALAVLAGNRWEPADVWAVLAPLFNQEPTPPRVVAAAGLLGFGLVVLAGSAVFCYLVYPRDPNTFAPRERHPAALRQAAEDALYHYTNQPGGLEYAGVIVLPAGGPVPSADQLVATLSRSAVTVGGYQLFECLDRRDARRHDEKWRRRRADREAQRLAWLRMAVAALERTRELGGPARACGLGEVGQVLTRAQQGGLVFEFLLERAGGEPEVIQFGVTTSADEVTNGRLALHFDMLREALARVIKDRHGLRTLTDAYGTVAPPA